MFSADTFLMPSHHFLPNSLSWAGQNLLHVTLDLPKNQAVSLELR